MEVVIAGGLLLLVLAVFLISAMVYGVVRFKNLFVSRETKKSDLTYTIYQK